MDNKANSPTHRSTSTTFKADAGNKKYHCGFFCQRKTESDVVDSHSQPKKDEQLKATLDTKIN
jgi:hypothetical protein